MFSVPSSLASSWYADESCGGVSGSNGGGGERGGGVRRKYKGRTWACLVFVVLYMCALAGGTMLADCRGSCFPRRIVLSKVPNPPVT